MAESSLTLTFADLKTAIGQYLGVSRTVGSWTAETAADVGRILSAAQKQFYEPYYRPVPQAPLKVHVWSFLRARAAITTGSGTQTYTLPEDFAGFLDDYLSISFTSPAKPWSLELTSMKDVLEHIQDFGTSMPSGFSQPMLAAVESVSSTLGTTGQRWQIVMWPTPASTLTVTGQYRLNPNALATDTHYPLGGEAHSQTLLESCLAAAEEFQNDQASTVHRDRFQELLAASIALDSRLHAQEAA